MSGADGSPPPPPLWLIAGGPLSAAAVQGYIDRVPGQSERQKQVSPEVEVGNELALPFSCQIPPHVGKASAEQLHFAFSTAGSKSSIYLLQKNPEVF